MWGLQAAPRQARGDEMTRSLSAELNIPVYYEDTDFSGYVYHANYLKYFERAREEILGREKLQDMFAQGLHFVAKEAKIQYHKPARHGDVMNVHTRMDFDRLYVNCYQTVYRQSDGEKLVTGHIQIVTVNARGFPIRIPSDFF